MEKAFDIEKLKGGENFHTWKFAIRNVLELKGYEKCIQSADEVTDAKVLKACKAVLSLSIEVSLYIHIQSCTSAYEIWTTLCGLYEDKGLSRKISLLRKLISTRLEDSINMQAYIDSIVGNANKLKGIGFKLDDEWIAAILLAGLTENYRPFIMGIEASNATLQSDSIISKLLDTPQATENKSEALFSKNKSNAKNSDKYKKLKCAYCKKKGHSIEVCRKKKYDENPTSSTTSTAKAVFIAHIEPQRSKNAFAATNNASRDGVWYVDSGASSHMTPHAQLLSNIQPCNVGEIRSANNAKLKVNGAGNAILKICENNVPVKDILHVPGLTANLLSVSHIASNGNSVLFNVNGCTISNSKNEIVAQCKPENGVYKFFTGSDGACMQTKQKETAITWHRRLGHIGYQRMQQMRNAVNGIEFNEDDAEIKRCITCAQGKQARIPFEASQSKSENILELIHTDLMGPMEANSMGGAKYVLTFVDDYTKKVFVFFLKAKSETFDAFRRFKNFIEKQMERKIKTLRSDNGTEYRSKEFAKFCREHGIHHQYTTPYTPQQNGTAERMNRTIVERAKCLLFDAGLPKYFWAEATNMAVYLINRTICASTGKVPEEMFTGKKVDLSNLKIFGSRVMTHIPKEKRKKWDRKSKEMTFVGYDEDTKGYRCIDRNTNTLIISRDVTFHENTSTSGMTIDDNDDVSAMEPDGDASIIDLDTTNEPLDTTIYGDANDSDEVDTQSHESEYEPDETIGDIPPRSMQTRARANGNVNQLRLINFAFFIDPMTVAEAKGGPNANEWKLAMDDEIKSHAENNTWSLTKLPNNRKPIKAKWVFKTKSDDKGNIVRYKARLVAKGCSQIFGIDYMETFSPVVRYNSIRYLLALAVQRNLIIHQMDAVTAFLQGDLEEEIYMEQPEDYQDGTNRVCKLNRSIYGLKQAGRQWNLKLDVALRKFGLQKSKMDPCIYYTGDLCILIAIYVDDFLLFCKSESKLAEIKEYLHRTFKMKDMGPVANCIGINIRQDDQVIEIDQCGYVEEILSRFNMQDCKPVKNPADTSTKLSIHTVTPENSLVGKIPYQEAVGALLYLAQGTRPDIAYAVNDVSRFNNCHDESHWKAIKRIFRYLRGTAGMKLRYSKSNDEGMIAYSDSDWASETDKRRSCTGYVIKMSGAAVCWSSKRQSIVALSSTEAEYIALSSTTCEIIWLLQMANELKQNLNGKAVVYCDNQSAMKLSLSDAYRPRTKHIDIRHHRIRELIDSGVIKIAYISTKQMAADALTKAVPVEKLELCNEAIGLKTT